MQRRLQALCSGQCRCVSQYGARFLARRGPFDAVEGKRKLKPVIHEHVDPSARVTAAMKFVRHSAGEYACSDASTNQDEGFFDLFKCGVVGSFHHQQEAYEPPPE